VGAHLFVPGKGVLAALARFEVFEKRCQCAAERGFVRGEIARICGGPFELGFVEDSGLAIARAARDTLAADPRPVDPAPLEETIFLRAIDRSPFSVRESLNLAGNAASPASTRKPSIDEPGALPRCLWL
jgi:hypothetical protein